MRNSVKTLIVGVVLAEVAFGAYLLTPKSDSADSPDSAVNRPYGTDADEIDSGNSHMITGNIERAPVHMGIGNSSAPSSQSMAGMVASAAPLSNSVAPSVTAQPQQVPTVQQMARAAETRRSEARTTSDNAAVAAVDPKADAASLAGATPLTPRIPMTREGMRHHNNPVAAAMTDQLVKESAKLDPNLPPPDPSFRVPTEATSAEPASRRSSNPVGDAMTAELVRQSSKLDPNLPPPQPASAR